MPGAVKVAVPCSGTVTSNAPELAVTVCTAASPLRTVILEPAGTDRATRNWKFLMVIVPAAAGALLADVPAVEFIAGIDGIDGIAEVVRDDRAGADARVG